MAEKVRSADQMLRIVDANPERLEALKARPREELQKLRDEAKAVTDRWTEDKWLYRIAIGVLGALALIAAIGSVVLVIGGNTTPRSTCCPWVRRCRRPNGLIRAFSDR